MKVSGNRRLAKWFAFLSALLFVSGTSTCGFWDVPIVEPEITVVVNVSGLTPDITALYVTNSFNGTKAQQGQEVTGRLDRFAIALPLTTAGSLQIQVVGRSTEKCVVASGTVTLDIAAPPPTRYETTVTLDAASPGAAKVCTLTVNVSGRGTVTSTPAGISCASMTEKATTCSGDFTVGGQISLAHSTDAKTLGAVYKGLCNGTGPCSFTFNGPGEVNVGIANRICSTADWCWHHPLPQGNSLRAIWGPGANDIWAAGDAGVLLHYNGLIWSSPDKLGAVSTIDFYGMHGTASNDIWVVGIYGALLHYDGTAWTSSPDSGQRTTQTLRGVWAAAKNDVWAIGALGTILHFDGTNWSIAPGSGSLTTTTLYAIWGSAANDIWAVGGNGVILHYNGTAWSADPRSGSVTTQTLYSVYGSARDRVYAASYSSQVLRYDGTQWAVGPASTGLYQSNALWVSSTGTLWNVGYPQVGSGGGTARFNGTTWQYINPMALEYPFAVFGTSDTDIWSVGMAGSILHSDGQTWTTTPLSAPITSYDSLQSVWGSGANDVWAVGGTGLLRYFDGNSWTTHAQSGTITTATLYSLWGNSPTNILAVGSSGTFLRYTGTWTNLTYSGTATTNSLYGVWGSGTLAWAVGAGGTLVSFSGSNPTVSTQSGMTTTSTLRGVWVTQGTSYYAAGYTGTLLRGSWSVMPDSGVATTNLLYGVFGTSATNIWAVGSAGTILRSQNGNNWTVDPASGVATTGTLYRVWTANPTSGWAVGTSGAMLRYNNNAWTSVASGTRNSLYGLWGSTPTDVWAAGDYGTLLRYQP